MRFSLKSLLTTHVALTWAERAAKDPTLTQAAPTILLERQIDDPPIPYTSCEILSGLAVPQTSDACSLASATAEASTSSCSTTRFTPTPTKTSTTTNKATAPSVTPSTSPASAWTSVQTDPKSYNMALTTVSSLRPSVPDRSRRSERITGKTPSSPRPRRP
jgi:hypothetical protein